MIGIYAPDEGRILLNGDEVVLKGPSDAIQKGIGAVFQEGSLIPNLSAVDLPVASLTQAAKRRSWSVAERQRIVDAALASGASIAGVARAHGVDANLAFKWIGRSREGWRDGRCAAGERVSLTSAATGVESPPFVPVRLVEPDRSAPKLAPAEKERTSSLRREPSSAVRRGVIEIRLRNGARVRVAADVDGEALRLALARPSEL